MSERQLNVILLSPTGQDAYLISAVLEKASISTIIVGSIPELCERSKEDAGVLIIAVEALTPQGIELLNQNLSTQEPWSDLPVLLLTSGGPKNMQANIQFLEAFISSGNVTLLERPLQHLTLISAAQVAMKSRRRQFQVKNLLTEQIQATKIRDEFISIAGHELKTPLTSLKLQTQMTKKISQNPENFTVQKMQKQLDYTINQIERLNKLVDDMLDISRINTGKLRLEKSDFNLSLLLEDLVERFMPQFEAVNCQVTCEIQADVTGHWDSYKIEQVINNLFSNSIRYSPGRPVEIHLIKEPQKAILSIKDYGVGIEPANLERIFERFERASSANSGLGLGLYITRQIIELHDGSIKVESKLGQGAKFIIELPIIFNT